ITMAHVVRQRMAQMVGVRGNANRYRKFSAGAEPPKVPKEVVLTCLGEKTQQSKVEQHAIFSWWRNPEVRDDIFKVLTLGATVFYGQTYVTNQKKEVRRREEQHQEEMSEEDNVKYVMIPMDDGSYQIRTKSINIPITGCFAKVPVYLPDQ
ncbi:hypothetical protein MKW94_004857, partial [Papaver nudicaule]|nr:hypothetical protein [Papaver nudicaule]MCL7033022.1 hypothetical protein [Papaver nudicaule]